MVSVNQISVDSKGEYIASCSDGMVSSLTYYLLRHTCSYMIVKFALQAIINGLYTDENDQKLNIGRAVKSIAIDPFHYKPGQGRKFIIGEYNLLPKYEIENKILKL